MLLIVSAIRIKLQIMSTFSLFDELRFEISRKTCEVIMVLTRSKRAILVY